MCELNEQALTARFLEGLSGEIKEEILSRDLPTCLDQLVELAIRLDKRFELRRRARTSMPELRAVPPVASSAAVASPDPKPMQLGGLRISAAVRQRRIVGGLCMYCGAQGHFRGLLASTTIFSPSRKARTSLAALLRCGGSAFSCAALVDSGAEGNFMD